MCSDRSWWPWLRKVWGLKAWLPCWLCLGVPTRPMGRTGPRVTTGKALSTLLNAQSLSVSLRLWSVLTLSPCVSWETCSFPTGETWLSWWLEWQCLPFLEGHPISCLCGCQRWIVIVCLHIRLWSPWGQGLCHVWSLIQVDRRECFLLKCGKFPRRLEFSTLGQKAGCYIALPGMLHIFDQGSVRCLCLLRTRSQVQVKSLALPKYLKILVITCYDHRVAAEDRERIVLLLSQRSHGLNGAWGWLKPSNIYESF